MGSLRLQSPPPPVAVSCQSKVYMEKGGEFLLAFPWYIKKQVKTYVWTFSDMKNLTKTSLSCKIKAPPITIF